MASKPADFFVGLVDFFAVLLPGALLLVLLREPSPLFLKPAPADLGVSEWAAFLVAAYILGRLLRHLNTEFLNPAYKWLLGNRLSTLEQVLSEQAFLPLEIDRFQWVRQIVRMKGEADSGFFRSLTLVAVVAGRESRRWRSLHRPLAWRVSTGLFLAFLPTEVQGSRCRLH